MAIAVSVVVPVYNTEKYLKECVDSLQNQTLRDVELIFVDDGSTDHSVEILEAYQRNDSRIQILRQQNQYAGVARNNGMKLARGKYIIFLDSDDFFEPTMLEEAYNCAEQNCAEITVFSFQFYDDISGRLFPCRNQTFPSSVFSVHDCSERFTSEMYPAPWNKLYQREFIQKTGLQFQPVRKSNDTFFVLTTTYLADRITFLKRSLVYYRINNTTSLQGNVAVGRESFLKSLVSVKSELLNRDIFSGNVRSSFYYYCISAIKYYYRLGERNAPLLRNYFQAVKSCLVPGLFESSSAFSEDMFISAIDSSSDFDAFLLKLLDEEEKRSAELAQSVKELYETRVSKQSKAYRLGQAQLFIPRKIAQLFSKKNK